MSDNTARRVVSLGAIPPQAARWDVASAGRLAASCNGERVLTTVQPQSQAQQSESRHAGLRVRSAEDQQRTTHEDPSLVLPTSLTCLGQHQFSPRNTLSPLHSTMSPHQRA